MTTRFNLLDEPWIPVARLDGQVREISLLDLFDSIGTLRELAETSPPSVVALYRMLLAITHRALTRSLGTWKDSDRARWYREGLPGGLVRTYLETWRDRFWVFHPNHPFMQVAALAEIPETKDKFKPWTQIDLARASGNTPSVFDHTVDTAPHPVSAATAIKTLMGFLQFTPGGLVRSLRSADNAGPLANSAACIPLSTTLARTLCLSLHPSTDDPDRDSPCWEKPAPTQSDLQADGTGSSGPNDRYTRLSRAVLLAPDSPAEPTTVTRVRFAAGVALPSDPNDPDPMTSYLAGTTTMVRLTFSEGRALWRDLPAIVPDRSGRHALPAPVLRWAANLYTADAHWDAYFPVLVAGHASDQAKLLRWRIERVILPTTLVRDPGAANEVRLQVERAEQAFAALRGLVVAMVAQAMPEPAHKDTRSRARSLIDSGGFVAAFFSDAERSLPELLRRISAGDVDGAHAYWSDELTRISEQAWHHAVETLGRSSAAIRAEARVWPRFRGYLRGLVAAPSQDESSPLEIET